MKLPVIVLDRSAVLLLGVCTGSAIGLSFIGHSGSATPTVTPKNCAAPAARSEIAPEVAAARQCAAPAQRQLLRTLSAGERVRVAVFGDSFGDGVEWGLRQQLPRKGFEVLKYSQPASGFTRYRRLNLEKQATEQLGGAAVDIAVVSFGANDTQGIITDAGEHAPLLSDKWKAQIGARLDRFVGLLRKHKAMVYWVGLPAMREPGLEADVRAINNFYAERMARLEVPFIDTRPIVDDGKGGYAAYLDDPKTGKRTLIRDGDGVHMSMTGYLWLTRGLSERIENYVDATRALEPPAAKP